MIFKKNLSKIRKLKFVIIIICTHNQVGVAIPIHITGAESVRSSYPEFREHLEHLHG
mgnify:CR=1 FL=1